MNLELLKQPFPTNQIKNRQTSIGMTVAYLETPTVINRLNDVFNGEWSFKIIEHKFLDDDVVVIGELTAEGITKQQFGTCELHQDSEDGIVLSMGDALKAAASDALKKSATLFGIGLQLYGFTPDEEITTESKEAFAETESNDVVAEVLASDYSPEEAEETPQAEIADQTESTDHNIDLLLGDSESDSNQVTDLQIAEIIDLSRQRNFTQSQVDQRARSRYGKGLAKISQGEAQEIIDKLKGN
jgi:hypothetical protein